jgi:hypothetical protein
VLPESSRRNSVPDVADWRSALTAERLNAGFHRAYDGSPREIYFRFPHGYTARVSPTIANAGKLFQVIFQSEKG